MKMSSKVFLLASSFLFPFLCNASEIKLTPVQNFNVEKYTGKWYEIARTENRFEKDCSNVSANYSLNKDGTLRVVNKCLRNGKQKIADGKAHFVEKNNVGALKVTFFWPFHGKYNVFYIDENYQNAIVGDANKGYLWILSRQKNLDAKTLNFLLEKLKLSGVDVEQLIYVKHD